MIRSIPHRVRPWLRSAGFDVIRYNNLTAPALRVASMLAANEIGTVLDVGANEGQYARELRRAGFTGDIVSFEPLPEAHAACAAAARSDPRWEVARRCALGSSPGRATFHVAGNSVSSSMLPMTRAHVGACPASAVVGSLEVPVETLDGALAAMPAPAGRSYLKIDTQGTELEVLRGARASLPQIMGLQIEMSLESLYQGGAGFAELLAEVQALGFSPWAFLPGFSDARTGRMLQVDGVFFRRPSAHQGGGDR